MMMRDQQPCMRWAACSWHPFGMQPNFLCDPVVAPAAQADHRLRLYYPFGIKGVPENFTLGFLNSGEELQ